MRDHTFAIRVEINDLLPIVWRAARHFRNRDEVRSTEEKGYGNYVTAADKAVQQEIREALAAAYPAVQFYAEEKDNGDVDVDGDYWILDPIDGTMNLMRDYAHSAISLGYAQDGALVLGVIYDPFRDELFYGEQGRGAYMLRDASAVMADYAAAATNPTDADDSRNSAALTDLVNWSPIHVSSAQTLSESMVIFGTSPYNREELGAKYKEAVWDTFMKAQDIRRFGAAVLDLAWIACGRAEVYYEHIYPWDRAAGIVIVREAGGKVCSYDGSEVPIIGFHDIIAGTPGVVDEVQQILSGIFG